MKKLILNLIILILFPTAQVYTQEIIFQDNFENHTVGTFPSSPWFLMWEGNGVENQIVVNDQFVSPSQSLKLECAPNWAANAQITLSTTPSIINCEGYLLINDISHRAHMGFKNPDIGPWGAYYARVVVGDNGYITCEGEELQACEANRWYHIKIKYDSYSDVCDVWVDDILKGKDITCSPNGEYNAFTITAGHPSLFVKAWFDDIIIYADITAPVITSITDVPNDQGKKVQIIWQKSNLDITNSLTPITTYSVWRFDEVTTFITQIPAMQLEEYSVIAPTLFDSCETDYNYSYFQLIAHTDNPWIYYMSEIDSGYSVNNFASSFAIDENLTNNNILIFPNPAHNELNISAEDGTIERVAVFSLTGQQILQERTADGTIDISHLQQGMYIVEVLIENTRVRQKLLVQR